MGCLDGWEGTYYAAQVSKAFTRDDGIDTPVVVPARAPLPPGVANYVTPRGLALLRAELAQRHAEHMALTQAAAGRPAAGTSATSVSPAAPVDPTAIAVSAARLAELERRVGQAVLVDKRGDKSGSAKNLPQDEVRFGAQVTIRSESGALRTYRLVGVDEADGTQGLVAFIAPLARALLGRRVGEVATLKTPRGEEELEIVSVDYDYDASADSEPRA